MSLMNIPAGTHAPKEVNVVIEIPVKSEPVKYEVDKKTGALFVDRFLNTAMFYPCNYGYVPETLSDDGDPVDVLVVTPSPLISGSVIAARPIGLLKMQDEKGYDAKVLAVPNTKICNLYEHVNSPSDMPQALIASISHFFEHYKDLEHGKWVKIDGWSGMAEAHKEIMESIERYKGTAK